MRSSWGFKVIFICWLSYGRLFPVVFSILYPYSARFSLWDDLMAGDEVVLLKSRSEFVSSRCPGLG